MKREMFKEKAEKLKEKLLEVSKKVGAKNMIILCAVLVCGVAVSLNFILAGNADSTADGDAGYKIDPSYYAGILENGDSSPAGNLDENGGEEKDAASSDSYFVTAVYNRDRARDEAIEVLYTVAESDSALDEVKTKAEADIAAIAASIEAEANIEELVKAKGFAECVAVINGELASIIVKSDGLLPSEIAQITEIVYEQAGILPTNMNIVEK